MIHKKFMELELSGDGILSIAEMVYSMLQLPIIITDEYFKILALKYSDENENILKWGFQENRESCSSFFNNLKEVELGAEIESCEVDLNRKQKFMFVRKVVAKNNVCGYIFVYGEHKQMDEMNIIILDHAVTTVALEFSKKEVLHEHMNLMENNFFIDLVMSNTKSEEEVNYRVQFFSWPKAPVSLIIFDIDSFEINTRVKTEMEILKLKRKISEVIYNIMDENSIECKVISKSDSFSCIMPNKLKKHELLIIVKDIQKNIKEEVNITMTVGVVCNIHTYMELCKAHEDARDAIEICRRGEEECKVVFISDVRFEQAILHSRNNKYLKDYIDDTIDKLIKYDKNHNTQLVNTLEILIENMGVRTQASEQLYLHRNTLLNRIRKIEWITGYDLSRAQQLFELGIALKIKKYL